MTDGGFQFSFAIDEVRVGQVDAFWSLMCRTNNTALPLVFRVTDDVNSYVVSWDGHGFGAQCAAIHLASDMPELYGLLETKLHSEWSAGVCRWYAGLCKVAWPLNGDAHTTDVNPAQTHLSPMQVN